MMVKWFQMTGIAMHWCALCRADTRQYVGPPTVEAISEMLKGGVQVTIHKEVIATETETLCRGL